MVCLDEMGPESAKSFPGQQLVRAAATEDQPAEQEMMMRLRSVNAEPLCVSIQ